MNPTKALLAFGSSLVGMLLVTQSISAAPPIPPNAVLDDFEDGDASDWSFFGGNNAGGGGGPLDDRPREGGYYFSTAWGGQGSASVFYGGFFKNLDNAAQLALPTDPWFNVWVLNQSDATADQYTLEITIREDLDGNGWTDGMEDSLRLDTTFASGSFNDKWVLLSAPLSSFANLFTGGDGTFDGNLDEIVVVISGVQGADGATVEVDFDLITFTSGGPLAFSEVVFDDMEHGDPFGNGWFAFGGSVGGGGIGPNAGDLPPAQGGAFSLETGWGSGGTPGFFGGFGRTNPVDLSGTTHFNFWINPDAGQDYTLEINLQDDDDGDGGIASPADDEFQYDCAISPIGPCAVAGDGWQLVSIPLDDFFDDNSFLTGGNGALDPVPTLRGGNGGLVNVVLAVISNSGADVTLRTDYWAFTEGPAVARRIIDDFESGLPGGSDGDGVPIGFFTFQGGASSVAISTSSTPPAPALPAVGTPNSVLQVDVDVTAFAGVIHSFENTALDTWIPQDWSAFEGISFWLYGNNSGTDLFVDLLENRNPGSTTDDAERWTVAFVDDFSGWRLFELPFADFARKEIGNGAPNDGLSLFEVHGWAFGTLGSGGPQTYYIDEVSLYGIVAVEVPELAVSFALGNFEVPEGSAADITVKLNRQLGPGDPAEVSVDYATEPGSATPDRDYTPTAGTLTFVNGGPSELTFPLEALDDSKYEGDEHVILRLSNLVDVAPGSAQQASAQIVDDDPFDPDLLDDFERGAYLWDASGGLTLETPEIAATDPLAVPGQGAFERILEVGTPILVKTIIGGNLCHSQGVVPVAILTTDHFDATTVDHTTVRFGNASEAHVRRQTGQPQRHEEDFDGDADIDLVFHFRVSETGYDCDTTNTTLTGSTSAGLQIVAGGEAGLERDFAIGQDWTRGEALRFWFYGTDSGDAIVLQVKDNRAPDPGPAGWNLVWSDEFDDPAGTPPNPAYWSYEIGDGTANGTPGWGNAEMQYYTDDSANAATDGAGNLVISALEADGSLQCYYGPCEYTSARLISKSKAEFAYGRIESRIRVPDGAAGLWPAFWGLGTDIDRVGWPQTGEIDFMAYVSRLPNETFGTIQGPGYSGGQSFGGIYDFGEPVFNDFHTFAVQWEPDLIRWYVDGNLYHTATPADVAPNEWVFNDAVFLLMNLAIGGNFGGAVSEDLTFPQGMVVDYVRVFQGPDTAERWEATFTDNFSGWQQVVVPFAALTRSAEQPAGAPDDGLGLNDVWGYGFELPEGGATSGMMRIDQTRLEPSPPPSEITVTNLNDSGNGSLRQALEDIAMWGTITFDPGLAGGTIGLASGPLVPGGSVAIDASDAPGLSLDGGGTDRVLTVDAGLTVDLAHLTITNGFGLQLAGGILNNGNLTLDHVNVTANAMTTDAGDFWQGGGGIYNGMGATLNLVDSTVSNNSSGWAGGGVFSFFGSTTTVDRSTISGNTAQDVGGGLRTLGNVTILNGTVSGNVSTAWHGGAAFVTDGVMDVINSTIADNSAPAGTSGGFFVGTFTDAGVTLNLTNTIIADNTGDNCFQGFFGAGPVTLNSGGYNIADDASCNLTAVGDQPNTNPLLGALSDNGGPTLTHALLAGSPAIDDADAGPCPATDQRGVARPQGAGCDVGSYEFVP